MYCLEILQSFEWLRMIAPKMMQPRVQAVPRYAWSRRRDLPLIPSEWASRA